MNNLALAGKSARVSAQLRQKTLAGGGSRPFGIFQGRGTRHSAILRGQPGAIQRRFAVDFLAFDLDDFFAMDLDDFFRPLEELPDLPLPRPLT